MLDSFNANHVNVHHSHGLSVALMATSLSCMSYMLIPLIP